MNKQDNQKTDNQQPLTEDLDVNEDQAAEVKGGPVSHQIEVHMHVIVAR